MKKLLTLLLLGLFILSMYACSDEKKPAESTATPAKTSSAPSANATAPAAGSPAPAGN